MENFLLSHFPHDDTDTSVFIDGSFVHRSIRDAGVRIDWKLFRKQLQEVCRLRRTNYYAATTPGTFDPIRSHIDWLAYNGFRVIESPIEFLGDREDPATKRVYPNLVGDIIVDAIEASAYSNHIIIISGDSTLIPTVKYLQRKGCHVTISGVATGSVSNVSDTLRRECDSFVSILDWAKNCSL